MFVYRQVIGELRVTWLYLWLEICVSSGISSKCEGWGVFVASGCKLHLRGEKEGCFVDGAQGELCPLLQREDCKALGQRGFLQKCS